MNTAPYSLSALFGLAALFSSYAAEITINDYSATPDGTTKSDTQSTDINALNGGNVLQTGVTKTIYVVTTMTFGAGSDAHLSWQFGSTTTPNRLGIRVDDSGFIEVRGIGNGTLSFDSTNPPNHTDFDLGADMAGQSVTMIAKLTYDSSFSDLYGRTSNTADDTLMNVWINPDNSDVEGIGATPTASERLAAGDMYALWNSASFSGFHQIIENQSTPGTAGDSFITDTKILTGADATFANALALATGSTPPTGDVDAGTSTVSASPSAVPADGSTTATVTVTLKDAGGNPVAGKEVSLSGNGSAVIATSDNISDVNGEVVFTVKSSVTGTEVFTATNVTDSNMVITETASVEFEEVIPVGPVDAGNSTVVASSSAVLANGISTSTITVMLKDGNGQLVVGEDVTLSDSPSDAAISPSTTQTTDANGEAAFTVSSSTIGTIVFSATSSTDSITITQTASVDFTDPQDAEAFNVNFLDDGQADETNLLGVVGTSGETWNQGTTSVSNLVDTTGTVTSSVNVSGLSASGRPISGSTLDVFKANRDLFGKGDDITISITGLTPDTPYDLYLFALSHNTGSWGDISNTERAAGDFVTTNEVLGNGQSQWLDNAMPGTNGNSFVPNGNYVAFESIVADGSGEVSIVVDAYDGTDGDPSTNDGNCRLHVCGLQIRPASGMSVDYMNWASTYYPSLGLPGEDDDNDGLTNDFERIYGMDPTESTSASPFQSSFDPDTGSFTYTRRSQSLANLNYQVWYSTNLSQWFPDNAANQITQAEVDDVELMSVGIDHVLLDEERLFVQLRAATVTEVDIEPFLANLWGSGNTITLLFSEPMNPSSAGNVANYTVQQDGAGELNITDAAVSSDGGRVTLTLGSSLGDTTGYTVTMNGVTSGTGQSLGNDVTGQFTTWDDDPTGVKVFILAGQSNMVGRGESERGFGDVDGAIGSLRYEVVDDNTNYGQLVVDSGNPATDPWVVRDDVNFWWNRADVGGSPSITKGGLNPQGFGSGAETFGPEFGFGWAVGEHFTEPVLIIKTAWGGKDLVNNYRPPSAVAARGGVVGPYYLEMIDQVREVLNDLGTQFPEWNGVGYQIAGFGWHQGWNDSLNSFASDEYEANMVDFITDIREVFGKPNLPVSIGTTGMEGASTSGNRLTVVNAQINVANPTLHPELGGNVFTVDTRPFARDTSESPTNDTTHWKNNGESMYLIGKGMGDGMVDMLSE